ncbi:MAG TPA: hypothetical protein VIF83_12050 [Gemmatimonadaceae bacterium]
MSVTRIAAAAVIIGSAMLARPVVAQCSASNSCSTTNTASVTIGALVNLEMSSTTTTLTSPTVSDLGGSVANDGPTFVVHANQAWTLSIKSGNAVNWTYTGSESGVKPIGDLTWSDASNGTFAAITASDATLASGSASTDNTAAAVFFKTLYSADYSDPSVRPGSYSLPVVFTLSAP